MTAKKPTKPRAARKTQPPIDPPVTATKAGYRSPNMRHMAIILAILASGTLVTCGVATYFGKTPQEQVQLLPDIPAPPLPPTELMVEVLEVPPTFDDPLPPAVEEVVVTAPKMTPPETPSYGVDSGFDCAFLAGGWSDALLQDAKERQCDVAILEYLGSTVYYYDVGFDSMQDISHRYN